MARPFWNWLKRSNRKAPRTIRRQPLLLEQLESREMLSGNPPPRDFPLGDMTPPTGNPGVTMPIAIGPQQSPSPNGQGYTPAQIQQAYGFDQLPGMYGTTYDNLGAGQTIAILEVGSNPSIAADVQAFDEYWNIGGAAGDPTSTNFLTEVNEHGGTTLPGDQGAGVEIALDVEWAHAMAPGANLLLVDASNFFSGGFNTAAEYAASQPGVSVISMSYGYYEYYAQYASEGVFTTPIGHQGVVFVASAGDSGAPPLHPSVFANVLAVGGTTLPADGFGNPDRTQETGWGNAYGAGGGGISYLEAQPSYQADAQPYLNAEGNPSSGFRTTPDLSYDSDPVTGFPVYDSYDFGDSTPWDQIGGTSDAAPQIAAMIAIVNQQRAAVGEATLDGPSQLLPAIYAINDSTSPLYDPNAFQDITTGNNGYYAGPGYDLVTGWGTPNVQNLVPDLVAAYSTPATPVTDHWTGAAGDSNWNNPANWQSGMVPGANTNVVIDMSNQTIFIGPSTNDYYAFFDGPDPYNTIHSLTVSGDNDTLWITFGTLDLSGGNTLGTFQTTGANDVINLAGGVLKDADVTAGTTITASDYYSAFYNYYDEGNVLVGVQLDGTLDLSESYGVFASIQGTLTLNGTILVGGADYNAADLFAGFLDFYGDEGYYDWYDDNPVTIAGTGTIQFGSGYYTSTLWNNGWLYEDPAATLTIGPGITIIGGQYSEIANDFSDDTVIDNQSTISETGGTLTIDSEQWTNEGQITATGGATVNLYGSWTNAGVISVDGTSTVSLGSPTDGDSPANTGDDIYYLWTNLGTLSVAAGATVNLGGFFTTDTFASLAAGGIPGLAFTFNLTGSIDNSPADNPVTGGVLVLNDLTGPLNLAGGYIYEGTIQTTGSDDLLALTYEYAYLDGVTLDGTLDASQAFGASIYVTNGLTLNGLILLGGAAGTTNGDDSLYFGYYDYTPETVGGTGAILFGQDSYGDSMENLSYVPVVFGPGLNIVGGLTSAIYGSWTNQGTITVGAGFTMSLGSPTYGASPANSDDDGYYLWTNQGTIAVTAGATLNLGGFFTADSFAILAANNPDMAAVTLNLTGSLDNSVVDNPVTRGTLVLNAATGPLYLDDGTIDQGTVLTTGSNDLLALSYAYTDLYAVTLDGTLDMSQAYGAAVYVTDGLTLNGTIVVGAAYGAGNGANLLAFGYYDDYTPGSVSGTGTIQFGQDAYGDSIQNYSNETLTFGPNITIIGGLNSSVYATYSGAQSAIDVQGTVEENTAFTPAGGSLLTGVLQVYGTVANYISGVLTGGTWTVGNGAALELFGANITTNAAAIGISGAGSAIYSDAGLTDALAGLTANAAGASFTVGSGAAFSAAGPFSNAGAVTIASGGSFSTGGAYTQSAGSTTVDGLLSAGNVQLNGGNLNGAGTIAADVTNAATVSPGTLTITGTYTQTAAGTLNIALGGDSPAGPFGQLAVAGIATLTGTLNVSTSSGFMPSPADAYAILNFATKTGDFTTETGLSPSQRAYVEPGLRPRRHADESDADGDRHADHRRQRRRHLHLRRQHARRQRHGQRRRRHRPEPRRRHDRHLQRLVDPPRQRRHVRRPRGLHEHRPELHQCHGRHDHHHRAAGADGRRDGHQQALRWHFGRERDVFGQSRGGR